MPTLHYITIKNLAIWNGIQLLNVGLSISTYACLSDKHLSLRTDSIFNIISYLVLKGEIKLSTEIYQTKCYGPLEYISRM